MNTAITSVGPGVAPAEEQSRSFAGIWTGLPQVLYYAILFTIPFYRFRHLSATNPILKVDWLLVMALGAIAVPYLFMQRSFPVAFRTNLWKWYGLFFLANVVSCLVSPYPEAAFQGLNLLVLNFLFISINLIMITREGFRKWLPAVVIASVTLNAALATLGYFVGIEYFRMGERGIGGTIGANNAALMGIFVVPLIVHWLCQVKQPFLKVVAVGALVINLLGLVSTESRGGFLNLLLIGFLILLHQRKRFHPRYLGIVVASVGIATFLVVTMVPKSYVERQQTLTEGTQADFSTRRRAAYLEVAWRSFLHHPVLGTGTETFSKVWVHSKEALRFKRTERPAHNTYAEVLVGSGLLGLAFFALFLLQALHNYNKAHSLARDQGDEEMSSLVAAYRLAYISVLVYFLFKSGIEHKMFLLALPLSQIALVSVRSKPEGAGTSGEGEAGVEGATA